MLKKLQVRTQTNLLPERYEDHLNCLVLEAG